MKKNFLTSAVLAIAGVGLLAGSASATLFTDTQELDVILGEGPIASLGHDETIAYSHFTPGDFEVPYDVVNSAEIEISGYWIDDNNDTVEVSGVSVGTLTPGGSYGTSWSWSSWEWVSWDTPSESTFDVTPAFSSWTNGSLLDVTITANGGWGDGIITLTSSTFTLDYDNGNQPVPEPATMLLFGTGLVGLAGAARRKKAQKK